MTYIEGSTVLVVVWSSLLEFKLGGLKSGSGYSVFRGQEWPASSIRETRSKVSKNSLLYC